MAIIGLLIWLLLVSMHYSCLPLLTPACSQTLQNVGPGTYNVAASPCSNSMGTGVGSAPVPFMSNMERVLMENTTTSMTTPGPGAYQADKASVLNWSNSCRY